MMFMYYAKNIIKNMEEMFSNDNALHAIFVFI
ncbi:hypothetical protein Xsto_02887 [Xenorhabdus stockiae]|uniref:Uncharacterized protein n=1 Tax=Xenorhabdus stockiae TaxID=351614 RepID=A0A2D0KMH8_9GAMM|nr:hypothetical protein Xsto_02887 [Xenorhabdus stockiae]